jgi:hypothetical protein
MRYQRIFTQIWNDEKFTSMSPGAQRLFLYLLTCPHSNLIGLYILKNGYIMEDLDLSPQSLKTQMQEIVDHGIIQRCSTNFIVFIPNYLKFNPLTNPNQVTSAIGIVESMPKSVIIRDFVLSLEGLNKGLNESLREGLVSVLESVLVLESEDLPEKPKKPKQKEPPKATSPLLGEHKNVKITEREYELLIKYVGGDKKAADDLIERLSGGIASKGYKYDSHYATMQNWYRRDGNEAYKPPKGAQSPTMTAEQEAKREAIKRDIKIVEDSLPGAQAAYDRDPSAENERWLKGKQHELAKLNRELEAK